MKIKINNFKIIIPNFIAFRIIEKKSKFKLDKNIRKEFKKILKETKKEYKDFVLLEVQDDDVIIKFIL